LFPNIAGGTRLATALLIEIGRVDMASFVRHIPFALLLAATVGSPPAWAQAAPPAASASGATGVLAPVTVTAERRTENIKDVPSSVSTISGEKLDVLNSSGEDVRVLSGRVPSLNIESSFGRAFPRFYIRGYGNTDFHLNASQPVSLVYDDVVQENPILKGFPVFDVDQVEVLAGPQGTLFGRNTPAGVVKFDSVKPSQDRNGYFNASYGRFGTSNLEGAFTLPLGPAWSTRISLQSQHRDDWVTNTVPNAPNSKLEGYDDSAARVQLLYQPDSTFSALFNLHGRDEKGTARLFRANIIQPGTSSLVPGFDPSSVSIDGTNKQNLTSDGGSARLRWRFGDIALNSISGFEHVSAFSRGDVDGGFGASFAPPSGPGFIPFSDETSDALKNHRQFSQEFRVESLAAGPLKWQAGLYYFNEKFDIDSVVWNSLNGGAYLNSVQTHQTNRAWATFGSVNYAVLPQLSLRAGLRYTHETKSLSTSSADDTNLNTTQGLARDTSDSKVNWDVSATYALSPDLNIYARIATGFRGSSIYPPSDFGPLTSAPPETNTSYEVGAKADLFDKRARLGLSIFHYDVKDQQLSAVGGADNSTVLLSAKKAMGRGVELNLDAYVTESLLITLNGSYNLTKIRDPDLVVFGCASCTVTNSPGAIPGTFHIDGNALPQAPKYIANITARYGIPTMSGGEYFVYTDWTYRSSVNFFLYKSPEFTGKAMTIGGLRLGYDWAGGKYEAALFARNITNQIRVVGGIDFNNLTGFINEPRTWGAQFKATF
jgi:iron complex outermembrane receptor protein